MTSSLRFHFGTVTGRRLSSESSLSSEVGSSSVTVPRLARVLRAHWEYDFHEAGRSSCPLLPPSAEQCIRPLYAATAVQTSLKTGRTRVESSARIRRMPKWVEPENLFELDAEKRTNHVYSSSPAIQSSRTRPEVVISYVLPLHRAHAWNRCPQRHQPSKGVDIRVRPDATLFCSPGFHRRRDSCYRARLLK